MIDPAWLETQIKAAERSIATRRPKLPPSLRFCVRCEQTKRRTVFDGTDRTCRPCVRAMGREAAHRRAVHKKWRRDNPHAGRAVRITDGGA